MKGLELAKEFYILCRPVLYREIPEIMSQCAIGLAGEGSECFGMDDNISQDHDYGPGFCLWLPDEIVAVEREKIEKALQKLPLEFSGYASRMQSLLRQGKTGPCGIKAFYRFFTDLDKLPDGWREWLALSEVRLAAATNGEVFEDNLGEFTRWRQHLLNFYPHDVWLKKIAARVMLMAQAGQYNFPRSLRRDDGAAAMLAVARFAEAALSFVFLINRKYMPFYKWAPLICRSLPLLGTELSALLRELARHPLRNSQDLGAAELVEEFCGLCASQLRALGISATNDNWLWAHGPQIISQIKNKAIRDMNLLEA